MHEPSKLSWEIARRLEIRGKALYVRFLWHANILVPAKKYDLPPRIIEFIACHHGTSLAGYFYRLAVQEDGEENVKQEYYRYDGPKPRSKEVALVMLADSCEAAVRSLTNLTQDTIKGMVHNIIKGKLEDGQLDECNLTFRDLMIIEERFCQIFGNVYHKRIAYPEMKNGGKSNERR